MRTVAIVLGIMLALTLVARLWIALEFHDGMSIVDTIKNDPGTVTKQVTYEGHPRTIIIDAAKHTTVTIDSVAGGGKLVTIKEPRRAADSADSDNNETGAFGSVHITTTRSGPQ